MTAKNLAIAGLTARAVLFLTAVFFLGYRIWLTPTGAGIAAAIVAAAFGGSAVNLRRQDSAASDFDDLLPQPLPNWVRTWQRIGFLLSALLLLTYFFIK